MFRNTSLVNAVSLEMDDLVYSTDDGERAMPMCFDHGGHQPDSTDHQATARPATPTSQSAWRPRVRI